MDTRIQYGNEIIDLNRAKTRTVNPELMSSSILDFGVEEAIEREAEEVEKNTGVHSFEAEARLKAQFGYQIKAMQNAESAMENFEKTLGNNQQFKDLLFELNNMGIQNNKAIQIVKKAISGADRNLDSLMTEIEKNLMNTKGLITTKGFVTVDNQQVAFGLKQGVTRIDPAKAFDFCKKIITQLRSKNATNSKNFQEAKKISEFATKAGLKLEDAKKLMEEKEIGKYNNEKSKTDLIDKVLKMQIPTDIRGKYSKEQIDKFEKLRREDKDNLALLKDKNGQIAELKRDISKQQDIINRIQRGEIPLSEKDKRKIAKALQKSIKQQEKMEAKLEKQNNRTRKQLSKYFDNFESYKAFVEAQQKVDLQRFDDMKDYHDAVAKGLINENEKFAIGPLDPQDQEFAKKFWQAEIQAANLNKNKNQTLQLPEGKDNSFKEGLRHEISISEQQKAVEDSTKQTRQTEQDREQD